MSSPSDRNETARSISDEGCEALLAVAASSIECGFRTGAALEVDPRDYAPELRTRRGTFVTVKRRGDLMGCIGTIVAQRPLVVDVARNAFAAVFYDPRCPKLRLDDVPSLDLHISLLGPLEPMRFADEADLIRQVRPGVDGLLLEEGFNRGTLLPAVWESIPEAREFVTHLKLKAGLPPTYWSETVRVSRYTAEAIP